jgi:hypothetical protein
MKELLTADESFENVAHILEVLALADEADFEFIN